eukprot:CAMPEP_0183806580 /NCGR_PEP_ID=MMETSP0803_2-20130417/39666_1 /TAXON_ID=195967 /ORGANISM="Crustomastix stigmata, Strain CCMP3273" /LENGTH=193 /DNA_ID=CAMNT_0026051347 /DNA_START=5 /DNA_END=583 /DNA_ORIENTATION=-
MAKAPLMVTCLTCGEGFGTASVAIHWKSCARKHAAAVEVGAKAEEEKSRTKAGEAKRRAAYLAKCAPLPAAQDVGLGTPPKAGSDKSVYDEYNERAAAAFESHIGECACCAASPAAQAFLRAQAEARARRGDTSKEDEEAERRRREAEEEEARKRREAAEAEAERLRREAEEAARRRAEEEEARRRAEEEARR